MSEGSKVWALLPYQARWVRDPAPVKVIEKSRRIGISWAEAYDSVLHAAGGSGNVVYISYSKDMTAGFIADCGDWAQRIHGIALKVDEAVFDDGGKEILTFSINFPSGKKIEALSSAPRQLRSRGRPGDRVIIDEAAFVDDIDALLQAAMAVRIWGGKIRIISTHNGELNPFAALVADIKAGNADYSLHSIPFAEAVADGLFRRVLKRQRIAALAADPKADVGEFVWSAEAERAWVDATRAAYRYPWQADEELDCVPASGAGTWISAEDFSACEDAAAGLPENTGTGTTWLGYDVARRRDLAVISAFEKIGGVCWLREMTVMEKQRFRVQLDEVARLVKRYRPIRIAVDQTGMGEPIVEQLQEAHGISRVEGVVLSPDRRLAVATALREAFENRQIRIPRDNALRLDVRSMRRAPGVTSDRPRLISDSADTDGHADRFWSMALAVAAAGGGDPVYEFIRVPVFSRARVRARGSGLRTIPGGIW